MNLRENALKSGGGLTSVRMDQSRIDDRFGAVNGGWMQNYVQPDRVRINAFKGMEDPRSRSLGLAAAQLKKNPFAHNIGG
jgi:predicted metalloendopeptidase